MFCWINPGLLCLEIQFSCKPTDHCPLSNPTICCTQERNCWVVHHLDGVIHCIFLQSSILLGCLLHLNTCRHLNALESTQKIILVFPGCAVNILHWTFKFYCSILTWLMRFLRRMHIQLESEDQTSEDVMFGRCTSQHICLYLNPGRTAPAFGPNPYLHPSWVSLLALFLFLYWSLTPLLAIEGSFPADQLNRYWLNSLPWKIMKSVLKQGCPISPVPVLRMRSVLINQAFAWCWWKDLDHWQELKAGDCSDVPHYIPCAKSSWVMWWRSLRNALKKLRWFTTLTGNPDNRVL